MKITQKDTNPFIYSDTNKRYHTYDYYLKQNYGSKVAKITLDCGFTCPNIDGSKGFGGCIYCSSRGSGDFSLTSDFSIEEQYIAMVERMNKKWDTTKTIPYFQVHTNTYADIDTLRDLYYRALTLDGCVGINIATRADCLPSEVCSLLAQLSTKTDLTVELGLQSVFDSTANVINRCHTYAEFCDGYERLKASCDKIKICVHLILGLPGETHDMMLHSAKEVAKLQPHQIKLHCLNVLKNTRLAAMYEKGEYTPLERDEYVRTVCDILEILPKEIVIGRISADADKEYLLAPEWTMKKTEVINEIDKELYRRNSYQGKKLKK